MQNLVLWLRRQGVSTLIVHHAGKNGGQRGTSRREDVMDSVIELRRPEGYDPAHGARFEVHFTKARGFMGADAAPLLASIATDERGAVRWEHADVTAEGKAVALDMFANGAKAAEVEKALGVGRATAFRWQKEWKEGAGHG
jgi:putative DNA primase/helicase